MSDPKENVCDPGTLYVCVDIVRTVDRFPVWKRALACICWRIPVTAYCVIGLTTIALALPVGGSRLIASACLFSASMILVTMRTRFTSPYRHYEAVYAPISKELFSGMREDQ